EQHQQDAEQEQRAVGEVLAAKPDQREIGVDAEAGGQKQQAESAEQVERPARVASDEEHGDEVEQPLVEAVPAVLADAVAARIVLHLDLADQEAAAAGEHRNVAVELAVDRDLRQHLTPIDLEATVEV